MATVVINAVGVQGAVGPQGPQGPSGSQGPYPPTGSFATTGSNVFIGNQIVTGSLFTTGSNTLLGNTTLTGSFSVSGSTVQTGNNTLIGNTVLSGSIQVSGSSVFNNSVFTVTGSTNFLGNTNINGNLNVISGSGFYLWGNKLFNYAAFSDTTTQSGSANTILSMSFNTLDDVGHGIRLVSGSRIVADNTGIYNLQFSSQFDRIAGSGNATHTVTIWFAYTGSSIANSATDVTITGTTLSSAIVASWNFIYPIQANDWIEIYWSTPSTDIGMRAIGTRTNPIRPAVPSVIATLTQIA